jgi:hypothetical protein
MVSKTHSGFIQAANHNEKTIYGVVLAFGNFTRLFIFFVAVYSVNTFVIALGA